MNSVRESHAGIASGINNAVSRTAGLLAIAVLGLVMFQIFNGCLDHQLDRIGVGPDVRQALAQQRMKLAAAEISGDADQQLRLALKQSIDECFVAGFRRVMLLGAGLAVASSLTAWVIIRKR